MASWHGGGANSEPLGNVRRTFGQGREGGSLLGRSGGGSSSSSREGGGEGAASSLPQPMPSLVPRAAGGQAQGQGQGLQDAGGEKRGGDEADEGRRRKKSRWGNEQDRLMPTTVTTILPPGLTPEQQQEHLDKLRIEEISMLLRSGSMPMDERARSPSPEPIYNQQGQRLNTREARYKQKLEKERHDLIQKLATKNPTFRPPSDYKAPEQKIQDKIMIPQEEHPEINFMGLLIGPRGKTLKTLEKDTGAKVMIRGRGTVKEAKTGKTLDDNEQMHALITAPTHEILRVAVDKINEIIRLAVECPEGQNELKRIQLRELALLNGTLRDDEQFLRCKNCGSTLHKTWQCSEQKNFVNEAVCSLCGGVGHIASDCRARTKAADGGAATVASSIPQDPKALDNEYLSLMAELGEAPKVKVGQPPTAPIAVRPSSSGPLITILPPSAPSAASAPRPAPPQYGQQPYPSPQQQAYGAWRGGAPGPSAAWGAQGWGASPGYPGGYGNAAYGAHAAYGAQYAGYYGYGMQQPPPPPMDGKPPPPPDSRPPPPPDSRPPPPPDNRPPPPPDSRPPPPPDSRPPPPPDNKPPPPPM